MDEHIEEIAKQINKMNLALATHIALVKATSTMFNRMKQEGVIQSASISHRIATAAFLVCDGNACIAIPKLKHAFGTRIASKYISKARTALQIPHGTAHEKLDSLCGICKIEDANIVARRAHYYVELLSEHSSGSPTYMAATSFYVALQQSSRVALTQREIQHLTGCSEIGQRRLINVLLHKLTQKVEDIEGVAEKCMK